MSFNDIAQSYDIRDMTLEITFVISLNDAQIHSKILLKDTIQ